MLTYKEYAEHRDANGMTDYKMSVLTGITKSTFSAWRHGKMTPKVESMLKIAKVLKLPPSMIVSKSDIKTAKLPGEDGDGNG